ncbi:hypothetical protein Tco_0216778 [Tanacetum coccineum]
MIKDSVNAAIAAERERQAKVRNDASRSEPPRGRDTAPAACKCTFAGFMKCNPAVFRRVKGAVELQRWFEKTESVFEISEYAEGKKVKFAAATLEGPALTWWKTKVATMGLETMNQMPWTEMKQLMTAKFCPIEEIQQDHQEDERYMEFNIEEDENESELNIILTKRWIHLILAACSEFLLSLSSTEDGDRLLHGFMRRDIDSLFGRMVNFSRRLCGRETAHALVEKKEGIWICYGKFNFGDLGNEVRSSVEQGTTAMEKLVEKLENVEEKALVLMILKKELEEAKVLSNTSFPFRMQNEELRVFSIWTRVRAS